VYNQIGCGFLEAVYQACLSKEFALRNIPYDSQPELPISYKGELLELKYRPDFIGFGEIILELKAVNELGNEHRAQVLNYLKASGKRLGFLVNFGSAPKVVIERIVL
jgi:GxxExxY protein